MKLALDTNRYADFARGVPEVVANVQRAVAIHLPFAVVAELHCGFQLGARTQLNQSALATFLAQPSVKVVYPDSCTIQHYAALFVHLRRQGTPIPIQDMWIAALCLQHDLILYGRDGHFDRVPQLVRL